MPPLDQYVLLDDAARRGPYGGGEAAPESRAGLVLGINVVARNIDDVNTFIQNLEASGAFSNVRPVDDRPDEQTGMLVASLNPIYVPSSCPYTHTQPTTHTQRRHIEQLHRRLQSTTIFTSSPPPEINSGILLKISTSQLVAVSP